jgi:hypothetical protein
MTDLQKLLRVAPPPSAPEGTGTPSDWKVLEAELGFKFPEDYKELIGAYGVGTFADFFGVLTPFHSSPRHCPYREWLAARLEGLRFAKSEYPEEAVPFPVHPEPDGLFPWGYTENGGLMCWLKGDRDLQPSIICLDSGYTKDYDSFELTVVQFIEKWLTRKIAVPSLTPPDFYPIPKPVFR